MDKLLGSLVFRLLILGAIILIIAVVLPDAMRNAVGGVLVRP
jgi:hypothetical protein